MECEYVEYVDLSLARAPNSPNDVEQSNKHIANSYNRVFVLFLKIVMTCLSILTNFITVPHIISVSINQPCSVKHVRILFILHLHRFLLQLFASALKMQNII